MLSRLCLPRRGPGQPAVDRDNALLAARQFGRCRLRNARKRCRSAFSGFAAVVVDLSAGLGLVITFAGFPTI
jgi:hypothetical protein